MQIQSTITATPQSTAATAQSTPTASSAHTISTTLADDTVQLSSAALAAVGSEEVAKLEIGPIALPPP